MLIEVLYFDGCPNHERILAKVRRLVDELDIDTEVRAIRIVDAQDAERKRFLGSPTLRVDGIDVEAGADEWTDYVLACRVYRTGRGYAGEPDERWLRAALKR
jgi:hypothetical protein